MPEFDRRMMRTKAELQPITTRLIRWGCFFRDHPSVGYAPNSHEARMMDRGGALPSLAPRRIPDNPEAEETEKILLRLPAELCDIAKAHYAVCLPPVDGAKFFHISRRAYFYRLMRLKEEVRRELLQARK